MKCPTCELVQAERNRLVGEIEAAEHRIATLEAIRSAAIETHYYESSEVRNMTLLSDRHRPSCTLCSALEAYDAALAQPVGGRA
ncbi:MAG: hypothetical protein A2Z21_01905 [Candidatus Fraserbacteria bacterium RBG_16_55_9]|uniref:Uncharacterized protein n=1 Tax=Fraserbacteria sp. (strain RBG_16_55_9) TaxID=1817864 RepID=A0A1F5UP50_FRAXR|nr:MAG: hypothetical protein A2Z21_01905 [Candidatus Fraserbacteria bacterium RBG_16_55_9]